MAGQASGSGKMARTSISLPGGLKREMDRVEVNWSAFLRQAIEKRLEYEEERDVAEAVLINERLRRKAPKGWDSGRVVRAWRDRRS